MKTSDGQAVKGTLWSMVERIGKMGIQLLCTLVIAHFVPPSEFGLVSMMSIFLAFSTILIDGGFGQALIHEQNVTHEDESSLFWFNVLLGLIVYLFFFSIAPLIANFYNQPQLTRLIRIAFLALIFQSFVVVQQGLLFKSVNFQAVSKISLWSVILSGIAGILISYIRHDVWGLIVQNLSFAIFQAILFWFYCSWRPKRIFIWKSVQKYLGFSLNLLGSNMLAAITDNLGNLVVGKAFNSSVLGNYTMANKIPYLTAGTVSYGIKRVSYSIMSTFQDDNERLSHYSQKIVGMAFWIIAPIMVFLFIESDAFIMFFFTPEWMPASVYLKYFCVWGFIFCFSDINQDIFLVKGRTDILFKLDIVRRTLLVAVLIFGAFNSIELLLQLLILYYIINFLAVCYLAGRLIKCSLYKQFSYQLNNLIVLTLTTLIYCLLNRSFHNTNIYIIIGAILFASTYIICSVLFRNSYFLYIIHYKQHLKTE